MSNIEMTFIDGQMPSQSAARGGTVRWLAVAISSLFLVTVGCEERKKRVEIPPFSEWVEGIDKEIPLEKREHLVGGFGSLDTLHIICEFTGATSPLFTANDLTEEFKSQISAYLPYLVLVGGVTQTEAGLWLEVNLTVKPDGTIYGHTRIAFRRDISIRKTNFDNHWQVWEDLITFDCDQNPGPDIYYNIELHAKKLCSMIVLAMRYQ